MIGIARLLVIAGSSSNGTKERRVVMQRRRSHSLVSIALTIAATIATVGCGTNTGGTAAAPTADDRLPLSGYDTTVVVHGTRGLVQTLRLSKHVLSPGDRLDVESVLTNGGTAPVRVWRGYTCRLDVTRTTLVGRQGCLPPTGPVTLAPGDSVLGAERWVIGSPPDSYVVAVQQTVDTPMVAAVTIMVRQR
jgi:hypothetical protein